MPFADYAKDKHPSVKLLDPIAWCKGSPKRFDISSSDGSLLARIAYSTQLPLSTFKDVVIQKHALAK